MFINRGLILIAVVICVTCLGLSLAVIKWINQKIDYDALLPGDIIFQISRSDESQAIQLATNSKYSHMGILFKDGDRYYVYEAMQKVHLIPLERWLDRGEKGHYVVKRLSNKEILTRRNLLKLERAARKYEGKPYDLLFEWSDEKIYCSELVWKIYKDALDIELCNLQKLGDFDLTNNLVKKLLQQRYGIEIPYNEKVVSPSAIYNSSKLITILDNSQ